jgi:hypothetical protein
MVSAPTLDGSAASAGRANTGSFTATLTTTKTADIIVVAVYIESTSGTLTGANTPAAITSVSSPNLPSSAWQQRAAATNPSVGGPNYISNDFETWWAYSANALTSEVITVACSGVGMDDYAMIAFGVNGCGSATNPWDGNGSLPAPENGIASGGTPSRTISTTQADDFIFAVMASTYFSGYASIPTGFSNINGAETSGGSDFAQCGGGYEAVTSTQSSLTIAWGAAVTSVAGKSSYIVDALTANAPAGAAHRSHSGFLSLT